MPPSYWRPITPRPRECAAFQDTALGKFLVDNCFNPYLKCQNVNCKRSARDHVLSFVHKDGRVDITVGWLKFDLAAAALASAGVYFLFMQGGITLVMVVMVM